MTTGIPKILIYGYGNPGRQDDGLGVMLADEIEKWSRENNLTHIDTDSNYQLNLEDAALISEYDVVIFADASGEDIQEYILEPLIPAATVEFTMHAVAPAFILHICHEVFDKTPKAFLLHIKGYEWAFMQEMTAMAHNNLASASEYIKKYILDNSGKFH